MESENPSPSPINQLIEDAINNNLERNYPSEAQHPHNTSPLSNFDRESKKLFFEFNERQREEMSVFERNFMLSNIDVIDDDSNFMQHTDTKTRKELNDESLALRREYNTEKHRIIRKQTAESRKFWEERNKQRSSLIKQYDPHVLSAYSLRPRSVSSSAVQTPARSRVISPRGSFNETEGSDRTLKTRSIPCSSMKMYGINSRYETHKSAQGFFLPSIRSMSTANKLGIFQRSSHNSALGSYETGHYASRTNVRRSVPSKTYVLKSPLPEKSAWTSKSGTPFKRNTYQSDSEEEDSDF